MQALNKRGTFWAPDERPTTTRTALTPCGDHSHLFLFASVDTLTDNLRDACGARRPWYNAGAVVEYYLGRYKKVSMVRACCRLPPLNLIRAFQDSKQDIGAREGGGTFYCTTCRNG